MSRFVFVTGGVMSSLGKGIASATIGTLLQARGFNIKMKKMDPYINTNPGIMSPYKHGEAFLMNDGCEADLDFGHYERFTGINCSKNDSLTTGKIYKTIFTKEDSGHYEGSDIQIIPHVSNEIKEFITENNGNADFVICEIGGTVGDIESLPYIESIRQLKSTLQNNVIIVHLTHLPYIKYAAELKTKPTQHSVQTLQSLGIIPDILLCRTEISVNEEIKQKLSMFCNMKSENVIEALDAKNIYLIPKMYHDAGLDKQICKYFDIKTDNELTAKNIEHKWGTIGTSIEYPKHVIKIAVVARYEKLKDAYLSLEQAINHAGFANHIAIDINWINPENNWEINKKKFQGIQGIIIPEIFENTFIPNILDVIRFSREQKLPFISISNSTYLAITEIIRNIAGINDITSEEFIKNGTITNSLGGGADNCYIKSGTKTYNIYQSNVIVERYKNKYKIDTKQYLSLLDKCGIIISGTIGKENIPSIFELKDHPFFICTLSHPEFLSNPWKPNSLLKAFVNTALKFDGIS